MPPGAMTPTSAPPVLYEDQMTPRPTLTPTPQLPDRMPSYLAGQILFRSDLDGDLRIYPPPIWPSPWRMVAGG